MRTVVGLAASFGIALAPACGDSAGSGRERAAKAPAGLVVYPVVKGDQQALAVESLDGRVSDVYRYSMSSFAVGPVGDAIAFASRSNGRTEIFVLRTESGAVEPLGLGDSLVGDVSGLVWSPAGDALAFTVQEPTDDCGPDRVDQIRLHVVGADGTDLRTLPWYPRAAAPLKGNPTSVSIASWSPDGRRVLYQVDQGSECEVRGGYLRSSPLAVVDVAGGPPVTIAVNHLPRVPVWSPDGTHVAVTTENEASGSVEIFDLRRGTKRTLTNVYGELVWTAQGIYTTLSTATDERARIVLLDPQTGATTPIARTESPSLAATASGSHVAALESVFAADYSVTYRVRAFARDGTELLERTLEIRRGGFRLDESRGYPLVAVIDRD